MMRGLIFIFLLSTFVSAQDYLDTLFFGGPVENRVNLVFVPEGYSESELPKFRQFVIRKFEGIFKSEPFYKEYRKLFNCFAIMTASNKSGVPCPEKGENFNTRFKSSVCGFEVPNFEADRLSAIVRKFMPQYDVVLLTMNNTELRAAAWASFGRLVIRGNQIQSVINHEIAHVLGDLADEYTGSGGNGTGFHGKPNSTRANSLENIPWKHWIEGDVPIPTPSKYRYVDREAVGLFEGANYNTEGWFRPKYNCLMRQGSGEDGLRLCPVCREAVLRRQFGSQGLNFLDGIYPDYNNVQFDAESGTNFNILPMLPNLPHNEISWYLNDKQIDNQFGTSLHLSPLLVPHLAQGGEHKLTVRYNNGTPYVKHQDRSMMKESHTWNLLVSPSSTYSGNVMNQHKFSIQSKSNWVRFTIPDDSEVKITVRSLDGKNYKSYINQTFLAGSHSLELNLDLKPGLYLFSFESIPKYALHRRAIETIKVLRN